MAPMTDQPSDQPIPVLLLLDPPDDLRAQIAQVDPRLQLHDARTGDDTYHRLLPEARIILGWPRVEDLPDAANLRWLAIASAGATNFAKALPDHVLLTNASGVFGIPIAEHILAMMLALVRGLPSMIRHQDARDWRGDADQRGELAGTVCGILGLGDIGRETARRAKAFGMRVIAVNRTGGPAPDYVDHLADAAGLDDMLAQADHLVVTLPGTDHTHHMLNRDRLAKTKPGARIYNVGRGSTIDENALTNLLRDGHLAGAGLDVFETEPLPADSPLWSMPNVIISPHRSGQTPHHRRRVSEIFLRNLPRFLAGQPLENLVDRHWQY